MTRMELEAHSSQCFASQGFSLALAIGHSPKIPEVREFAVLLGFLERTLYGNTQ